MNFNHFFLTTEGELPQSGKRSRPGACASEKILLSPQTCAPTARALQRAAISLKKAAKPLF
jgi:hypothetical protein